MQEIEEEMIKIDINQCLKYNKKSNEYLKSNADDSFIDKLTKLKISLFNIINNIKNYK